MRFTKMEGIGNDFVVVDTFRGDAEDLGAAWPELAAKLCRRKFGIGADGLVLLEVGTKAPFRMRMYNPDGSESEMCGNAIRCVGRLIRDRGYAQEPLMRVETKAGVLSVEPLSQNQFRVDMGPALLLCGQIGMRGEIGERFVDEPVTDLFRGTAVSMGNPHLVIFTDRVDDIDLSTLGPSLESQALFPDRVNVHFVERISQKVLKQRTWERGAGVTLACGTGACASAVAGFLTSRSDRQVEVQLPGGKLDIEYLEDGRVLMSGPAGTSFEGQISP